MYTLVDGTAAFNYTTCICVPFPISSFIWIGPVQPNRLESIAIHLNNILIIILRIIFLLLLCLCGIQAFVTYFKRASRWWEIYIMWWLVHLVFISLFSCRTSALQSTQMDRFTFFHFIFYFLSFHSSFLSHPRVFFLSSVPFTRSDFFVRSLATAFFHRRCVNMWAFIAHHFVLLYRVQEQKSINKCNSFECFHYLFDELILYAHFMLFCVPFFLSLSLSMWFTLLSSLFNQFSNYQAWQNALWRTLFHYYLKSSILFSSLA